MAKKIATKKKKVMTVDELKAYRVAYGGGLSGKDYFIYVFVPALLFGAFSFVVLFNGWITALCVTFGIFYGVTTFLPRNVKKQYESEAFNQRNKFLNNITQVLTDNNQTVLMAIRKVTPRSNGEFREDLKRFNALLIGADNERIRDAVVWFSDRYEDDVIFTQYLEQLETSMVEGKTNIDTLKDIKTYHNDIRKKQDFYERGKNAHLKDMKTLVVITFILVIALVVSFGFGTYLNAYARHPIGYASGSLYLLLMFNFFRTFSNYLFDDSVMEVRK